MSVIDFLITPRMVRENPKIFFLFGFVLVSLGLVTGAILFFKHVSLLMIFFTTLGAIPIINGVVRIEETKTIRIKKEINILKEHRKSLKVFIHYFFGCLIGYLFWYILLLYFKPEIVTQIFQTQLHTIEQLQTLEKAQFGGFIEILVNNVGVLFVCISLSFIFGFGSIFVLTWNASVIATSIAKIIQQGDYHETLRFLIHGSPEVIGYIIAGLAGGIISVAISKHHIGTKRFRKIMIDAGVLFFISILLIITGAFLEAFVTPIFSL